MNLKFSDPTFFKSYKTCQNFLLALVILMATLYFAHFVHHFYPLQQWLFWRYMRYWFYALLFFVSCLASGMTLLSHVLKYPLPLRERTLMGFAIGFFIFFLGMFLGGLLGLYGPVFFFAWPSLLLLLGWPALRENYPFYRQAFRGLGSDWNLKDIFIAAFALIGLLFVYFPILTPYNVAYDARWYHLPIAEHYAAEGAIRRFAEGWYLGAYPHLASIIYTWAFLQPFSTLFDRIELAAHLEFVVFLMTLAGIPVLVRRMVPNVTAKWTWVFLFLFPEIFLYDSSLSVGADHMAAFFAIPIYLMMLEAWEDLSPKACLLLAMMLAGAILTKYSALIIVIFPVVAVLVRGVALRSYKGLLLAFVAGVFFLAPHWLKNWIWYRDPLYPMLHSFIAGRPWSPDATAHLQASYLNHLDHPGRNLSGLWQTLKTLFTFSFIPNDWTTFHGQVPVFGSLFTLLMFCLPLVRAKKRLWFLFLASLVAVFFWYSIHHFDRYLQIVLPWMVVATASMILLAWQRGWVVRVLLCLLIGLQIIWGSDVPFFPTHAMIGQPFKVVIDLLSSGYRKDEAVRKADYGAWTEIGRILPKHAKVLVHDQHVHLGLQAMSVNDWLDGQGGLSYGRLPSAKAMYDELKKMGVTHITWDSSEDPSLTDLDSLAGYFRFFDFVTRVAKNRRIFDSVSLVEMPSHPPLSSPMPDTVAFLGCNDTYLSGFYHLSDLTVLDYDKRVFPVPYHFITDNLDKAFFKDTAFIASDARCQAQVPQEVIGHFSQVAVRRGLQLWVRNRGE